MATSQDNILFQCSGCRKELDLYSKTLPCLHSFCRSCLAKHFNEDTNGKGQCPECCEPTTLDQLSLSPILAKPLKRRQLDLTDCKCDLCLEDGIESTARNCCPDCQKLFCANCSRIHRKLQPKHNARDLDEMERGEVIKEMAMDLCSLHQKGKDLYCVQCNVCFCETCYEKHSADSAGCLSPPLSVREEALKQKSQGPTLVKEMDDLQTSLRGLNQRMADYTEKLNSDCHSECKKVWLTYEEMRENAKQKTNELCAQIKQITAKQVERWRHLLEANEKILKQLEIWRLNLHHLMSESPQDGDVVCGLRSLGKKLSSRLQKSVVLEEKCQLNLTFSVWWPPILEQLKSQNIGLASLTVEELPAMNLVLLNKEGWNVPGVSSMHISKEDDHVFLTNVVERSIVEMTESGEFVCECQLFDEKRKFTPFEICSISSDILMVACGNDNRLIILERRKIPPLLQIKKIIPTERKYYSFCQINETILICNSSFQVVSFTREGKKLKTIRTVESKECCPRIRADPLTGNFWVAARNCFELYYFNCNGDKLRFVKNEQVITDFCVNESGHLYFCNKKGIFSFSPKTMYKFEKESESFPRIFVLRSKIFVCLKIDGKHLIKIFRMLN